MRCSRTIIEVIGIREPIPCSLDVRPIEIQRPKYFTKPNKKRFIAVQTAGRDLDIVKLEIFNTAIRLYKVETISYLLYGETMVGVIK